MYQNEAWKKETGFTLDFTGKPLEPSVLKKGGQMSEKKLIYWIENLKLGLQYRIKLAKESGTIAGCKGLNAEMSRDLGRVSAYEEVIKDLDKVLKID